MTTMNSFDRTPTTSAEYRPILRVSETDRTPPSQEAECCCPELCQLDHGN
jgi:hypothetical protein